MNLQQYLPYLLIVLGLARVVWAQFTWRRMREGRVWILPGILLVVGLVFFRSETTAITPLELGLLAIEALLSIGTGLAMGRLARFRTAEVQADAAPAAPAGRTEKGIESRTGWLGLALWLVVIAIRVGFAFWGHAIGATALESTGAIVLLLGLNRAARALVLDLRVRRLRSDLVAA